MKSFVCALACTLFAVASATSVRLHSQGDPIAKVISLIDDLTAKIKSEGAAADKAYNKYVEWCDETTTDLQNEVKTNTAKKKGLEANIFEFSSNMEDAVTKIEELAAIISKSSKELEEATEVRKEEAAIFKKSDAELSQVIDMLARAVEIIAKEMRKSPAALTQMTANIRNSRGLLQSLSLVADAAAFSNDDRDRLAALVQSSQDDADSDDSGDLGAPDPAAHESKSGGILEVLEDMKEKAEVQLSDARESESKAKANYNLFKQSLEDEIAANNKDMKEQKAAKAEAEESKATAEGDLSITTKALASLSDKLDKTRSECIQVAADQQETVKSRAEELNVIAEGKKVLLEATGGKPESFLQFTATSRAATRARTATKSRAATKSRSAAQAHAALDVVGMVKRLAKVHHSASLAQLASRITTIMRYRSAGGDEPFAKVRGLIEDMIGKLEREAKEDAGEKAFCDEEMSKTEAKKSDIEDVKGKLGAKIEQAVAKSGGLKAEVTELEAELAKQAKAQKSLDDIRQEQNADFLAEKAEIEKGLAGVQKALAVLRAYYASDEDGGAALVQEDDQFAALMRQPAKPKKFEKSAGGGTSIIGILEVSESDLSKNLADIEAEESDEQEQYDKATQSNKIIKAEKDQSVKFKTQEYTALDKSISDMSSDLDTIESELGAVNEYYAKVKGRCVAKPDSYEEQKKRREAEMQGLREALSTLESETALVQVGRRRSRALRGGAAP